ncbi:MAG: YceI family protein [Bacteroidia bacterium]|nr:YceI family protein [Bacteroidia bacterium]
MKKIIFSILVVFISFSSNTQESTEVTNKSSISFKIKNFGVNVDGHFERFSVKALFNSKGELIDIKARIQTNSITTGMQSRDKHLLDEDYFFIEKFPEIVFETIDIKEEASQNYILTANLTIKGFKQEIIIPIHVKHLTDFYVITSDFEINRKDFDVGKSSLVLGKTVKISVKNVQKK